MLRGHIDGLTSLGFIEGWAYDQDDPSRLLYVAIRVVDEEVASGFALGFREDLMHADCGLGWCAFRLRLNRPVDDVMTAKLDLIERSSNETIFSIAEIPYSVDEEKPFTSMDTLVNTDPTIIKGIWQLRKCEILLMQFIRQHGVETFIDVAYAYVLGRAADHGGRSQYTRCLRQGTLTPVGILETLGDSDEFRSRVRQLAAPKSPEFPFS